MNEFTPPVPKRYSAEVKSVRYLTWKNIEVVLENIGPEFFSFIPGQFINLEVSQNTYRSYSIASDYKNPEELTIVASVGHEGTGADFLKSLKSGQVVNFIGPSGRFLFKSDEKSVIFIGTGTGITPIISMLYQMQDNGFGKGVGILFGVRHEDETFYLEKLKEFESTIRNFSYTICISQPKCAPDFDKNTHKSGRVTEHLPIESSSDYYICGHPEMIQDVINILSSSEVKVTQIYSEKFSKTVVKC